MGFGTQKAPAIDGWGKLAERSKERSALFFPLCSK
jgi:hypothetical protein